MFTPETISKDSIRAQFPEFQEKTRAFLNKELSIKDYKGFSGKYGSYAQRGADKFMLRLRMSAGHLPKDKLKFILDMTEQYPVPLVHFTTCQAVQLHDLEAESLFAIMDKALDADIICYGGGGDFPRNVMCSPLAGVDPDEYFDVQPYAKAAADFLLPLVDAEKMPRKLKVAFSSSPANRSHATFRDLGFAAREDGKFDVYAAGGLGVNPMLGVKVAEAVNPEHILYHIKAMRDLFLTHGNYQNRTKARTRFMVEALGGEEAFKAEYARFLKEAEKSDLDFVPEVMPVLDKTGNTVPLPAWNVHPQKQAGLYMVEWHPLGGTPKKETLKALYEAILPMEGVELRLAPDESCWIVNLTGEEADKVNEVIAEDTAKSPFETSISCVGVTLCQVGVRDSQGLLRRCIEAVRKAGIPAGALPQMHVSGCPSSCGTHQAGSIGFRGGVKLIDKKPVPAFTLFVDGNDRQGEERLAEEVGSMEEEKIPAFLVALGQRVADSGLDYAGWIKAHPEGIRELAREFGA